MSSLTHLLRKRIGNLVVLTFWAILWEPCPAAESERSPNVLFIAIDDLRTELGCYGEEHVQSPHLDRLAAQGVLFKNHFVQVPTCGASRYALLTGRSPARSLVTASNNALYGGPTALLQEPTPGAQTMPA